MKPEWQDAIAGWVSDNIIWILLAILVAFGVVIPLTLVLV